MQARFLALGFVGMFVVALVVSVVDGLPSELPGVVMGSSLLLHFMRAAVAAGLLAAGAVVAVRLWAGELPTKLSTTGAEWAAPLAGPVRDVQEQLLRVEGQSREAVEELARRVDRLGAQLTPSAESEASEEFDDRSTYRRDVTTKWGDALNDAHRCGWRR